MTENARRLLNAILLHATSAIAEDPHYYSPHRELLDAVLHENLPPEFERNIGDLADRFITAQEALWEYAKKHPLGKKMASEALNARRGARGIAP